MDRGDEPHHGGWIDSLKEAMLATYPELELGIAFPSLRLCESISKGRVTFFPILRPSPLIRVINNWRHVTDPQSTLSRCTRIVSQYSPDIVHIFGTEMIFGGIIPKVTVPTTIHLQGLLTIYSRMWFRGFSPWRLLQNQDPVDFLLGRGYIHDYFRIKKAACREREILRTSSCVMGRTDWDRRVSSFLAPHAYYYHCDETLQPEFWANKWQRKHRQQRVLFSTFNGAIYKGLETLLEAFALVRTRLSEDVILRIAGIGKESKIVSMIHKVPNIKRPDTNVFYLGSVKAAVIASELADADVFVHPSHIDNSPNSVCEAMLVGTPVVSTNAGGIPSLVINNEQGLLVQDGDPLAMAGAISELLMSDNLCDSLSQKARARAIARHNPARITRTIYSMYTRMSKSAKSA